MFKNLKDKIATQVNKTNQTILSTIASTDLISSPSDSTTRTSSITSHDDHGDNNRSRLSSASSEVSHNYVSPTRQFIPPSDVESENAGDESDHEANLLRIYKNKFSQLKSAYREVEHERDHIKNVLQQQQDTAIKRQTELRQQIKHERQAKEQSDALHRDELALRDSRIQELTQQLSATSEESDEIRNLREKNTKLETLLARCKEAIKTHQEKQVDLVAERDELLKKLESMAEVQKPEETSREVNENIIALQADKQRLESMNEENRLEIDRLINETQAFQQQIKSYEETINKDKQTIEQQMKSFDSLKIEHENLIHELDQTKQAKETLQSLLDSTTRELSLHKEQNTDGEVNEIRASLVQLQRDYDESLANCARLTNTLETQRQEHLDNLAALTHQHQTAATQAEAKMTELLKQIQDLETSKSQSYQQLTDEYSTLKQQTMEINKQQSEKLTLLQGELEKKSLQIDELKSTVNEYERLQTSHNETKLLLEEKDRMIDELKQEVTQEKSTIDTKQQEIDDLQRKLSDQTSESNSYKTKLNEQENRHHQSRQQQKEIRSQLESELKTALSEKTTLEHELSRVKTNLNEITFKLEQQVQQFETESTSYQNEIQTLKNEIVSLINANEENTRRMDEYENQKFDFEQDIDDKTRQIQERDEKIQELELTLKQAQDSAAKLRKALQNMKDSLNPNDTNPQIQKLVQEYEQRLKDREVEYNVKLKAMAKEMSSKIEESEVNYQQQINDLIQKNNKIEADIIINTEKRTTSAEQRALVAETYMSKMQEELKQKQLDHHHAVTELKNEIQKLTRTIPLKADQSSQTQLEDVVGDHTDDAQLALTFEPTEVDYLKQIVLAYMTGTDRLTMAKVICAVLRYTDREKSLIIEHEKIRQSRWLSSSR